jgi:hypothetical protein
MFKKNLGPLDRTVRLAVGVALVSIGLFRLGGWRGNARGIRVAVLALLPLATGVIGSCPAYGPLGISTLKEK